MGRCRSKRSLFQGFGYGFISNSIEHAASSITGEEVEPLDLLQPYFLLLWDQQVLILVAVMIILTQRFGLNEDDYVTDIGEQLHLRPCQDQGHCTRPCHLRVYSHTRSSL